MIVIVIAIAGIVLVVLAVFFALITVCVQAEDRHTKGILAPRRPSWPPPPAASPACTSASPPSHAAKAAIRRQCAPRSTRPQREVRTIGRFAVPSADPRRGRRVPTWLSPHEWVAPELAPDADEPRDGEAVTSGAPGGRPPGIHHGPAAMLAIKASEHSDPSRRGGRI